MTVIACSISKRSRSPALRQKRRNARIVDRIFSYSEAGMINKHGIMSTDRKKSAKIQNPPQALQSEITKLLNTLTALLRM
jgi:hypothetical protein